MKIAIALDLIAASLLLGGAAIGLINNGASRLVLMPALVPPHGLQFGAYPSSLIMFAAFILVITMRDSFLALPLAALAGSLFELSSVVAIGVFRFLGGAIQNDDLAYTLIMFLIFVFSLLLMHRHKTKFHFTWLYPAYLLGLTFYLKVVYFAVYQWPPFPALIGIEVCQELGIFAVAWRVAK